MCGRYKLDVDTVKALITEAMTDNEELITAWQNAWLTTLRLIESETGQTFENTPDWVVYWQSSKIMLHTLLRFQELHVN